jgi:type IV pilus assembly protein PilE
MITVAVVGILAAIAYPTYQGAMVKNRRAAAKAYLADVAQRQQQYLMDARSFAADATALKAPPPDDVARYYDVAFTVSASLPPAFTATLNPRGSGSQAADGALGITQNGTKFPAAKW